MLLALKLTDAHDQDIQRCTGTPGKPCTRCELYSLPCVFPAPPGSAPAPSTSDSGTAPAAGSSSIASGSSGMRRTADGTPLPPGQGPLPTTSSSAGTGTASQLRAMSERLRVIEQLLVRALPSATGPVPEQVYSAHGHHHARHASSSAQHQQQHGAGAGTDSQHSASIEHETDNPVGLAGEALAVEGLVDLGGFSHATETDPVAAVDGGATSSSLAAKTATTPSHHAPSPSSPLTMLDQHNIAAAATPGVTTMSPPDAIERGIMTPRECQETLEFYFDKIDRWTMLCSDVPTGDAMAIRMRSPILFHAMLVLALYYREPTQANMRLYRSVVAIVNALVAPLVLCVQPDQLSTDFVRAFLLLLAWKPSQYAAMRARGLDDLARIEHASKINVSASWMMRSITSRVALLINLPATTNTFLAAFTHRRAMAAAAAAESSSPSSSSVDMPSQTVQDHRLYLSCVFHDAHGSLQSGRPSFYDVADVLRSSRPFAELADKPTDVRLAAAIELTVAAARLRDDARASAAAASNGNADRELEDVRNFNDEIDAWEEHWIARLGQQQKRGNAAAGGGGDGLAHTIVYPYAKFYRCTVNAYAFSRWKAARDRLAAASPRTADPLQAVTYESSHPLSPSERACIVQAVGASESLLFALTMQGRDESAPLGRAIRWTTDDEGRVPLPLTLDADAIEPLRWASDSLTCVVFVYPLILLARLASAGLLMPNLDVIKARAAPLRRAERAPFDEADKLCRLLELGACFLDTVAPNRHHPAVKQAAFLRRLRSAGLSGGNLSRPRSPDNVPVVSRATAPPSLPSAIEHSSFAQIGTPSAGTSVPALSGLSSLNSNDSLAFLSTQDLDPFASMLGSTPFLANNNTTTDRSGSSAAARVGGFAGLDGGGAFADASLNGSSGAAFPFLSGTPFMGASNNAHTATAAATSNAATTSATTAAFGANSALPAFDEWGLPSVFDQFGLGVDYSQSLPES